MLGSLMVPTVPSVNTGHHEGNPPGPGDLFCLLGLLTREQRLRTSSAIQGTIAVIILSLLSPTWEMGLSRLVRTATPQLFLSVKGLLAEPDQTPCQPFSLAALCLVPRVSAPLQCSCIRRMSALKPSAFWKLCNHPETFRVTNLVPSLISMSPLL